ncbi:Copia protein, partial [Mucuna pruriens]
SSWGLYFYYLVLALLFTILVAVIVIYGNGGRTMVKEKVISLLLNPKMSNSNFFCPYTMFSIFLIWLTILSLYIGLHKDLASKRMILIAKDLLSPLCVMFVKFQSIIVLPFFLIIVKVFLLLILFIPMYEHLLLNLLLGLDGSIDQGIIHELTFVNTSQLNEVVKRNNCHLFEVARVLLYCGETFITAIYRINILFMFYKGESIPKSESIIRMSKTPIVKTHKKITMKHKRYMSMRMIMILRKLLIIFLLPRGKARGYVLVILYLNLFVLTISLEHEIFIVAIDAIKILTSIHEVVKYNNWTTINPPPFPIQFQVPSHNMTSLNHTRHDLGHVKKNSTWDIVDKSRDKRAISCSFPQQFDVKNVFLHGDIEEEVCMEIPPRFKYHGDKNKVCNQGDHTLFIKHSLDDKLSLLLVYVEDIIIAGDDEIEQFTLKERLAIHFDMKELRKLKYFLGIEFAYSKKTSLGKGLLFRRESSLSLEIYTDVDHVGSVTDRRYTLGYYLFLGGNLVTWQSKKKNVIAWSRVELDFQVMAYGICEGLWIKIILDDLKAKYKGPMKLFCDNN